MLIAIYQHRFKKDLEIVKKRGKNIDRLKAVLEILLEGKPLPVKNRNHKLKGDYQDYWECHIEPGWLLIYKKTDLEIILARTGTHADLF